MCDRQEHEWQGLGKDTQEHFQQVSFCPFSFFPFAVFAMSVFFCVCSCVVGYQCFFSTSCVCLCVLHELVLLVFSDKISHDLCSVCLIFFSSTNDAQPPPPPPSSLSLSNRSLKQTPEAVCVCIVCTRKNLDMFTNLPSARKTLIQCLIFFFNSRMKSIADVHAEKQRRVEAATVSVTCFHFLVFQSGLNFIFKAQNS